MVMISYQIKMILRKKNILKKWKRRKMLKKLKLLRMTQKKT